MTTCVIWSQPDPDHFSGLCTNVFRRNTSSGVYGSNCQICVEPQNAFRTCDTAPENSKICRQYDGTPIGPGGITNDQWNNTWTPFYTVTITLPSIYRIGAPWYYGTTGNCDAFYIGSFTLGTVDGRCGDWRTFLTDPDERYSKTVTTAGCPDRTTHLRMVLTWASTNPVMTLTINYRVFTTNHTIVCRYSNAPTSPTLFDCRIPISFQTWRNSGGDWAGSTAFNAISDTPGASVTLTPLYIGG